ncbi:MAG: hypothetical protein J7L16_06105 [Deltaproteobacteria bacterium]|nr:hypothetical protein [Deltaproteobacteria bacterium]
MDKRASRIRRLFSVSFLKWTLPAVDDLEAISEYIEKDSEFYAAYFIEKKLSICDEYFWSSMPSLSLTLNG